MRLRDRRWIGSVRGQIPSSVPLVSPFLASLRDLHRGQEVPLAGRVVQPADPVPVRVLPAEPAPEDHPEEPHRAPLGPPGLEIPGQGVWDRAIKNSRLQGLASSLQHGAAMQGHSPVLKFPSQRS